MTKQLLAGTVLAAFLTLGFAGAPSAQAVDPKSPDSARGGVLARRDGAPAIPPTAAAPVQTQQPTPPVSVQQPKPQTNTERPRTN